MSESIFPAGFLWGTATASYQVEGAAREDGRGESIWDTYCREPGRVFAGENGDVSCDQYHRYQEDIRLLGKADIRAYRFSIAWPRILPDGTGKPNSRGIAYYKRLIGSLTEAGIEPVATLYHWDLPQVLENAGGWPERNTAYAFKAYAQICFEAFGDSVRKWITLNEPYCSAYLGYRFGGHAPGRKDPPAAYRAVHHLNLAHGLAVKAYRDSGLSGEIGIVWNLVTPRPATRRPEDIRIAESVLDIETRMFTNPVLGKPYPELARKMGIELPVETGDMELIASPVDFIGLNYYTERPVSGNTADPTIHTTEPSCERVTAMGWPVIPEGLLRQLRWINGETGGIPLYIMENGSAEDDVPVLEEGGKRRVHDTERIEYLRGHIAICLRALREGIPLQGYFVWSFIDNFEWAFGYSKRFGIVYCDYTTLERIPKDSFYFFRDVISGYARLD